MPPLHLFYHCWVDGAWGEPLHDFLAAVDHSGLSAAAATRHVCLVGHPDSRANVAQLMPGWEIAAEAETGFTQVTLDAVQKFAHAGNEGIVFYAHNKGAMNNTEINRQWRRSMYRHVLENWRVNIRLLEDHDAVGCHWLTPEQFPQMSFTPGLPAPRHFGGEVWAATLDHIRQLPPLRYDTRWDSEPWIGYREDMKPYDLLPGWPNFSLFDRPVLQLPE